MDDLKNTAHFVLLPFQEHDFTTHLHLSGTITRNATGLRVVYELRGSLDEILLPLTDTSPRRRNDLWQATCFEFFVGEPGAPQYREINLSPSGDWNIYFFSGYRQGMREETAITALPFAQHREPELYQLVLDFSSAQLIAPDRPIEMAVTAILQGRNGERACYALTHYGPKPDFHQRKSFVIQL